MDRDKRWERVVRAYDMLVDAAAAKFPDAPSVVTTNYANDKSDEFIEPAIVGDYAGMKDGDGVLLQLPRRPRARNLFGATRSGLQRF